MAIPLAQIALQHDFQNVFADVRDRTVVAEDIYLSCYKAGSPSVHGYVNVSRDDGDDDILLESRDGVELIKSGSNTFAASCPSLSISNATLRAPRQSIDTNKPGGSLRRITAFDVSPDASLLATGYHDGTIELQPTSSSSSSPQNPLSKIIHKSTVLSLRFFPSSTVLLSSGSDFALNIVSASSSDSTYPLLSVARTLKGHTRGITDTAILGRGRNILSCAKDGSIRLWDVAEARKIGSTLTSEAFSAIMKMAVSSIQSDASTTGLAPPNGEPSPAPPSDPSNDAIVFAALQNGTFNTFDLRTRSSVHASTKRGKALHSIAHYSPKHLLATGSEDGVVTLYDTRAPSSPLYAFQRSQAAIYDLQFVSDRNEETHLVVAPADGFTCKASVHPDGPTVVEEYVGCADLPVRAVRYFAGESGVWTAGDDGVVRRY